MMNSRATMMSAIQEEGSQLAEREQRGTYEDLVRQRIEELTEGRHLVTRPGEISIDAVGHGEDREDTRREPRLIACDALPVGEPGGPRREKHEHEHGDQDDTDGGHKVCDGENGILLLRHERTSPSNS